MACRGVKTPPFQNQPPILDNPPHFYKFQPPPPPVSRKNFQVTLNFIAESNLAHTAKPMAKSCLVNELPALLQISSI